MRSTSYHSGFYSCMNVPSAFTRLPLFPASLLSSLPPSLRCGGRCGCLNPNFTAAGCQRSTVFVSFSELPDPDRAELRQQHTASRKERKEQRNDTDKGRIAASGVDTGRKKGRCDGNMDRERRRWQARKWERGSSHIYFFEYIKAFDR